MKKIDQIYDVLSQLEIKHKKGVSAYEISDYIHADRSNVSRYLNILVEEGKVDKMSGRPVLFRTKNLHAQVKEDGFGQIIGAGLSLHIPIQQAKAAIFYPPKGLHTLLLGETGVGKSMFAEKMYIFAKEEKVLSKDAPFIHFNCADYASNPQLLVSQIFGVKKGAYTGAIEDKEGLLLKAHGGMLFLDEVHRLSPEGQEMLFTFIDKKTFRPLGEAEASLTAEVQIIAATTEDPSSYLLKTFTRRIPMTIYLPSLSERSIEERYQLIQVFIKMESKRVDKSIYINKQSLISFLLYDCPNNIGQLKSDLQLACAKAFLNYKSQNESYILITQIDIPKHVKRGVMKIKAFRDEIDHLLKHKGDILRFYFEEEDEAMISQEDETYFYSMIEEKVDTLKASGMKEYEINQLLNIDIESYFKHYIGNLRLDELKGLVSDSIIKVSQKILTYASETLNRTYDERIMFGLSLHLHSSIERITIGKRIFNPKLNIIRGKYDQEFIVAMESAKFIDKAFDIQVPLDEIGYLTMFLASDHVGLDQDDEKGVFVMVVAHGHSTASSMVQVAKALVDAKHVIGLDMALSMKAEDMYDVVKEEVLKLKDFDSILLLVDMGSLLNFGDMIYEETGMLIKTIDMVSTPIVLDACRKAELGREIHEIYEGLKDRQQRHRSRRRRPKVKEGLILTACFTGEGASEKLKQMILENIPHLENIRIESINILNRREYLDKIEVYKKQYRLLAIVSTIAIDVTGVTFVSAMSLFSGEGIGILEEIIIREDNYFKIIKSLKEHIHVKDVNTLMSQLRYFISEIEIEMQLTIKEDVKTGMILHMSFLIDKLIQDQPTSEFKDLKAYKAQYSRECIQIKNCLGVLEEGYLIQFSDDDIAYLCKMIIENKSV